MRKLFAIITLILSVGLILNEIIKGMKRILPIAILMSLACFALGYGATPQVFFSDLTDGPISGWETSDSVGAAVSVWGLNFDTTRGTSYITCGGTDLTADGNYAEWGVNNAPTGDSADFYSSARGLERITFWLDSSMATGATYITVVTSEGRDSVPFYCRELGTNHIYFISRDGSDSDSGFYADTTGHGSEGPWKLATKVRTIKAGDIAYFREGIWNEEDATGAVIEFHGNHNSGEENKSITMTSYPGEIAQLGDSSIYHVIERWGVGIADTLDYWTISKFMMRAENEAIRGGEGSIMSGRSEYLRLVGNDVSVYEGGHHGWGFCGGQGMNHLCIYGNHIHDIAVSNRGDTITLNESWRNYPIYVLGYGVFNHMDMGWNEFAYNQKGRVQFYGHLVGDWIDSLYFHDNYVHHHGFEGLICGGGDPPSTPYEWVKQAWIYNNIFAFNGTRGTSVGRGVLIGGEGYGGHKGSWFLYNNTFYGNGTEAIRITVGVGDPPDTVEIKNNIIYVSNSEQYYDPNGYTTGNFFYGNNNCYYNGTDGIPVWDSTGSFETNPFMSNPASGNFHLQATSPCIDSGVTISMVDIDYDGNTRPYDSAYDIGAYEFQGIDSLIQFTNLLTTTTATFSIKDSVKTTYSVTCDSVVFKIWSANDFTLSIRGDGFSSDNVDTLIATGLQGNTEYFYWCIASDEGYTDTTDVDSVTTEHPNFLNILQ